MIYLIKSMKIYAFIFARGGSKEFKKKNLRKINNKELIYYPIAFAKKIKQIDKIFISTDDEKIKKTALKYGSEIINRPKKLAGSKSPELLAWKHAVKHIMDKGDKFDLFVSLPATSPIKNKKDILGSIKLLKKNVDIVMTAKKSKWNPWFNMLIKNKQNGYYDLVNSGKKEIYQRQLAPKTFDIVGSVYVTRPNYILRSKNLLQGKKKIYEIPESRSIDIDSLQDFNFAKMLMKSNF